jgi:hypothetical protein
MTSRNSGCEPVDTHTAMRSPENINRPNPVRLLAFLLLRILTSLLLPPSQPAKVINPTLQRSVAGTSRNQEGRYVVTNTVPHCLSTVSQPRLVCIPVREFLCHNFAQIGC